MKNTLMTKFYFGLKILQKFIFWSLAIFISFILLLGFIAFIADTFFDNAAKKDSCADSGGAWNYKTDECMGKRKYK
ncbi:hypothetical protein [Alkanindiges illinoisensis]|uniref:hypothetical protein n=1 Tax=Alkanindiges illinoisensis TaxID=197183 RepID=UPI001D17CEEA|nr:hypothetical protein [Alkanindiges illinoisensis]